MCVYMNFVSKVLYGWIFVETEMVFDNNLIVNKFQYFFVHAHPPTHTHTPIYKKILSVLMQAGLLYRFGPKGETQPTIQICTIHRYLCWVGTNDWSIYEIYSFCHIFLW